MNDRLGIVSNCWKRQLDDGQALENLIEHAADAGFRFIELRQGCLGRFEETESRLPHSDLLCDLKDRFADITFDLAVELSVLSGELDRPEHEVQRLVDGAQAVGGHLRIVDLKTRDDASSGPVDVDRSAKLLADLAGVLKDGIVSLEHSIQKWDRFYAVFERAGTLAGDSIRLCFDPSNLWVTGEGHRAAQITASIPVEQYSMVHLKQRRGSTVLPDFAAGDVNWSRQLKILRDKNYSGPFLFEIAPGENVWEELAAGRRRFESLIVAE